MSIVIFIISLAILILVHEFGHFIVAKKSGIRVDEFGLGLPPRIWGKKIGETIYSINWIPFGGFVKIFGEDLHNEEITEEDKPRSFYYKPKWIQSLVLVAGVTFNIIFAWLIISLSFSIGIPAPVGYMGYDNVQNAKTVIINVLPGSPAEKAKVTTGATLIAVSAGDVYLEGKDVTPEKVSNIISNSTSDTIGIWYRRGEETPVNAFIKPKIDDSSGRRIIGIAMDTIGIIKLPVHKAIFEGARTTVLLTKNTAIGLGDFLYKAVTLRADLSQVAGPVGIAGTFGDAKELGFVYILSLVALISINLALINLIPFPALDGGRLFFILIEIIIRRPISPKVFQWTNTIGFALLIILMFVITGHDILKLI
jgi:regulator of sigma E protease